MKNLVLNTLIAAFLFISLGSFTTNEKADVQEDLVYHYFSPEDNLQNLVKIQNVVAEKGGQLIYKEIQFDEEGKLTAIDIILKSGRGNSGGADGYELDGDYGFYFRPNSGQIGVGKIRKTVEEMEK